jgi:two-component system LytT family sensor kinase
MMDIKNQLKHFKLTFWHYQLIGWIIFLTNEMLREYQFWATSINTKLYLIITWSVFFSATLGLRYVYRLFYKLKKSPLFYLILISIVSIVTSFFWQVVRLLYIPFLFDDDIVGRQFSLFSLILLSAWVPFTWSILYFGIKYWNDLQEESERSKASLLLATTAQLQMLRYQINPHFLFNSLNSIKALTYENPEQAGVMLTELSEFLRTTLSYNGRVFVPIKEEIEIIEKYLSIEKIRFEERLNYKINYDKIILEKEILCFITQPIVENAIKHGLTNNPAGIDININFSKIKDYLSIDIENTGVLKEHDDSNGTGLKNVIERLDNAYSKQYILSINDDNGVVKIRLLIPYES